MVEALDVLLVRDDVSEVIIDRAAEDRIINEDAVHLRVGVCSDDLLLELEFVHLAQLEAHAVPLTGAPSHFGIDLCRRVGVCRNDEQRCRARFHVAEISASKLEETWEMSALGILPWEERGSGGLAAEEYAPRRRRGWKRCRDQ